MHPSLSRYAFLIIWSLWAFLASCVTPQNSGETRPKEPQSFLWEAQRGAAAITLVGTMHIGIRENDMDPELWQRLEAADTVIIETDLNQLNPALMHRYMTLPAGETLDRKLGAKHWPLFLAILREEGSLLGEEQLKRMSPLAAGALLLQLQAKADKEIAAGEQSIDQIIFEKGQTLGKATKTLETNQEQLESLKAVFTVTALQKVIEDWQQESGGYEAMKQAFKSGDSETLESFLKEVPEEMRFLLLEKRNRAWIQKLPELLGRHTILAVGAAHYAGPTGLLELLKNEGYTIRRITN